MKNWDNEKSLNLLYKALLCFTVLAAFVVLFYWGLPAAGEVLHFVIIAALPFVLAWLCAIISEGATDFFNTKLHMPRSLAVIILVLLAFGFIGTVLALVGARLWVELTDIAANISQYYYVIPDTLNWIQDKLVFFNIADEEIAQLQQWLSSLFSDFGKLLSSAASGTVNIISATPAAFVFVIVFFVALFFFCRDHKGLTESFVKILPEKNRDKVFRIYNRFAEVVRGFCVAQLIMIFISMLTCIIFFFILGIEGALSLGLLCGVLDILPIVGPALIITPWCIISFIQGNFFLGFGLLILQAALVIIKNGLQPKIVGDHIGLHPLLTLVGIFVGMRIFGLWGLALGPILLAMCVCVYQAIKEVNGK